MKKLYCLLAFLCFISSVQALQDKARQPLFLTLHERQFTFSTYYDIDSDQGSFGNIIKNKLSVRTSYQYFDKQGNNLSYANLRVFSLGSLFTWAAKIDLYDGQTHSSIGMIEGSILTFLPSKFSFYNGNGELIGIAYMDATARGLTLVDPKNEACILASYHRIFVDNLTDHWTIAIEDTNAIDLRLLLSFGAFVLDNQSYFREDN